MTCTRRTLILALSIAGFLSAASANDKNNEAKALVQKAIDISDIRKEGAPPFRLKASLRITNDDGSVIEGAYSESWVSKEQWRKEIVLGDFQRTQVAIGRKSWTLDSSSTVPNGIRYLGRTFDLWALGPDLWKADKFEDLQFDGSAALCFRTKPENGGMSELCFDKTSGAILGRTDRRSERKKTVDFTYMYQDYQRFGDRLVATSYKALKDKKPWLQAKVSELTIRPELDQTMFAPLAGGREVYRCPSRPQPPKAIWAPEPRPPAEMKDDEMVTLSVFVGTDGKPHDLTVIDSVNNDYDQASLEAVRQWRFKPASCEGKPTELEIAIEVHFHFR